MNKEIIKERYNSFIFDFDGVILDSNNIKKDAIRCSVKGVLSDEKILEFVEYFTQLNGIPREEKFTKYVPKNEYSNVLNRYEVIINKELSNAKLIPGISKFLDAVSVNNRKMIILSGGTEMEVKKLIVEHKLNSYFSNIYGGPKNKQENLSMVNLERPVLYFGDSEVDYKIANENNFDFIFVYGATNLKDWGKKISSWNIVGSIENFEDTVVL
jgi:phosphoglycolate phosphatase-like HAD superfamily hydrolase